MESPVTMTTTHAWPAASSPRVPEAALARYPAASQPPRPHTAAELHGTRKTCGSLQAALDVHPRLAMQILRHGMIAVTLEIHAEVPSAAAREAHGAGDASRT